MYNLGYRKPTAPWVRIECGWITREMGTTPTGSMRGTGWKAGGEAGATEKAAGGVDGATRGTDVEAEVVEAVHGVEVEVRVVVATCGMDVEVGVVGAVRGAVVEARAVGVAVEPSASATQMVGLPKGTVQLLGRVVGTSVMRAVRPPGGARSDRLPLQQGRSDCLEAPLDYQLWSPPHRGTCAETCSDGWEHRIHLR
jgi:hypothetical protein